MLYDAVDDAGDRTPEQLRAAYLDELVAVVADIGVEAVVEGSGLDRETVEALGDGDDVELTLEEAAAVLALADGAPDADDIAWEARDHLLMGMTTGILNVDSMAAEMETELDGKEIQQAIEGRLPVTLTQFAALQAFIASNQR